MQVHTKCNAFAVQNLRVCSFSQNKPGNGFKKQGKRFLFSGEKWKNKIQKRENVFCKQLNIKT